MMERPLWHVLCYQSSCAQILLFQPRKSSRLCYPILSYENLVITQISYSRNKMMLQKWWRITMLDRSDLTYSFCIQGQTTSLIEVTIWIKFHPIDAIRRKTCICTKQGCQGEETSKYCWSTILIQSKDLDGLNQI